MSVLSDIVSEERVAEQLAAYKRFKALTQEMGWSCHRTGAAYLIAEIARFY